MKWREWPRGLKIVLLFNVAGILIGTGQLLYFAFVQREFWPWPTVQGYYTAVCYLGVWAAVAMALLGRRKGFIAAALTVAIISAFLSSYWLLESAWIEIWTTQVSGRSFHAPPATVLLYSFWNLIVVAVQLSIAWYLWSRHVRVRAAEG